MKDARYIVVAGGCLVQFTMIGFLFSFSLFFKEIEADLGWSRTLISAGSSIGTLVMGSFAIFGGKMTDRFGPRRVLLVSGAIFSFGVMVLSQMTTPWHYLVIYGAAVGIGLATHDVVTLSTVARWFDRQRGLMTAVVKTGTALGQVVVPPLAAVLIGWVGWRHGMAGLGAAALVLLTLAALMMRVPPTPQTATEQRGPGLSFAEARRSRVFWVICAMQFLFFPTMMTIPLHIPVHGQDLGMSPERAALLLSVLGAASVFGRLSVGLLSDRIGGRNSYSVALGALFLSLAGLPFATAHNSLTAVMALYGFSHGALFVVVSPTVARVFGTAAHGQIFGTVLFFGTLGGAVGPVLAGWVFDRFGSYTPAFWTLAAGAGCALVLSRLLPRG